LLLGLALLVLGACPTPRPPPVPVDAVLSEPIRLTLSDGLEVGGEITLPVGLKKGEKRPGIVLIHGSGPADQDETIPGDLTENGKPARLFAQLAQALSRSGFIVLRYHKRGVLGAIESNAAFRANPGAFLYTPVWSTISRETLTRDAARAVERLRSDPRVSQLALLGFSEGTMIAPLLAAQDPSIRALILLSSVGRNLKDVLHFQEVERQAGDVARWADRDQDGALVPDEIGVELRGAIPLARADANLDGKISRPELSSALDARYSLFVEAVETGDPTDTVSGAPKGWYRSWFQAEKNLSLLPRIRPFPILLVHGEDDMQTPFETEAKPLYEAMLKAGRRDVSMLSYPGLGHGFSLRRVGRPTLGPIDPQVLAELCDWARRTLF
jgi:hypothetical protein